LGCILKKNNDLKKNRKLFKSTKAWFFLWVETIGGIVLNRYYATTTQNKKKKEGKKTRILRRVKIREYVSYE
jgi:hypothetical protein